MSYSIVESGIKEFSDNSSNIKLPRFQRKQTWGAVDNFKLCISVFKDYPVGVVIVNRNKDADWLLDGRQRRNALKLMRENLIEVYIWASKFIGIKPSDSVDEVKTKFWRKIDIYLQKEFDQKKEIKENNEYFEAEDIEADEEDDSFDAESQYASLVTLLDMVLLVHGKKVKKKTYLEQMFMFDGILPPKALSYTESVDGEYICNPVKLRKKILDAIDDKKITVDTFYENLLKMLLPDDQEQSFKNYIKQHWDYYERCIDVVKRSEAVFARAKIGVIRLINATVLDAQNIFTLVNAGGTKLSAEELLSARPFWNVKVENPSGEVKDEVCKLYNALGIDQPADVYRWDYGATFMSRIDKKHLIFNELPLDQDNSITTRMSLGFKLLSAIYLGGITNNDVTALENPRRATINWETDIDSLVGELNQLISVLDDCDYFKYLSLWNKSIQNLTTNAVAQEFLTIMFKRWKQYGMPMKANLGNGRKLCKDAVILFDRLIFEYSVNLWRGSSDSRLANDLKKINERLIPISLEEWMSVLHEFAGGTYKGAELKSDKVKGVIYHYCAIRKIMPVGKDLDTTFEIDHIVAQNIFENGLFINKALKQSIANLSPLPKGKNIQKLDKPLNQISDEWLKGEIKKYTDLTDADIDKYSDITNIEDMCEKRMQLYYETFGHLRTSLLAN